jgi:N-acyl amino acid synthase of PEP-CTERM/exosortase system
MSELAKRIVQSRGASRVLGEPSAPPERLLDRYDRYFMAIAANTPALVRQAQEIRYQVYCVEHQFEDPSEHLNGRESDRFDAHSVHSLLIHRPSGQAMGTVRLVLPRRDQPDKSFAIQLLKEPSALEEGGFFPLASTGEVSRFSISKHFRRRTGDTLCSEPVEEVDPSDRRKGPLMRLGLIQALVRMSEQNGITHWCATMEPKLLRMLANMSIHFINLGDPVEYHGLRQPCYCRIDTVLNRVKYERPDYWEVLTDGGTLWRSPWERIEGVGS